MQKIVIPVPLDEFRDQDSNLLVWMGPFQFQNVLNNRSKNEPIRRLQDHQAGDRYTRFLCRLFDEPDPFVLRISVASPAFTWSARISREILIANRSDF